MRREPDQVPLPGRVPSDEARRRGHAHPRRGRHPDQLLPDRPRAGDRLRQGPRRRPHGRDRPQALELWQGHAGPALLPGPHLQEPDPVVRGLQALGRADAADLQLLLRRPEHDRDLHHRPAAAAPDGRRPRPAHRRSRRLRVDRLPGQLAPSPGGGVRRHPRPTGTRSRRATSSPATTASATRARSRA